MQPPATAAPLASHTAFTHVGWARSMSVTVSRVRLRSTALLLMTVNLLACTARLFVWAEALPTRLLYDMCEGATLPAILDDGEKRVLSRNHHARAPT